MKRKATEKDQEKPEKKEHKKKKRSKSTLKEKEFVNPNIPKSLDQVSSNWRALQAIMAKAPKKKTYFGKKIITQTKTDSTNKSPSKEIWFDDVDADDIVRGTGAKLSDSVNDKEEVSLVSEHAGNQPTKRLAMDCEMVGIGSDAKEHMLARVSIVNVHGQVVLDTYVAPQEPVRDYRTSVSGIRPKNIHGAPDFKTVQKQVSDLLQGRVLVGHAIKNDLKVLLLDHPKKKIRDTQKYKPFQKIVKSKLPSLKKLSSRILGLDIQTGEHSSVEDSRVAMKLYRMHKLQWERSIKEKKRSRKQKEESSS